MEIKVTVLRGGIFADPSVPGLAKVSLKISHSKVSDGGKVTGFGKVSYPPLKESFIQNSPHLLEIKDKIHSCAVIADSL